jgi:hypothetical protein
MASRSTFREPAGDVAWQRQLRDRYADEPMPPVPHLDVKRAVVRAVSRRVAEQIILKYEWLGTMAATCYHFGLFFGPFCAGVTCIGSNGTAKAHAGDGFGIPTSSLLMLSRGACVHWAPPGSNSKLIAWTARLLGRAKTGKLIIAYADSDAGEIGTVYQAAGWAYIGRSGSAGNLVAPNGRAYNRKILYDARRSAGRLASVSWAAQRDALLAAGWRIEPSNPKHRYVSVLDRSDTALVARIDALRQPYPKRAKQSSDAPAVQAGEGGAAPTGTLQEAAV